jgi:peptide deformylase
VTRDVVRLPHPALTRAAVPVDPRDPAVVMLAADLVATMRASPACVGLAANQVDDPRHVFCMDVTGHPKARTCHGLVVLANAVVVAAERPEPGREGCLSVPDLTGNVTRSARVVVRGLVPGSGEPREVDADAIEARCLLHELDHLAGLLFLDRVDSPHAVFPRQTYR